MTFAPRQLASYTTPNFFTGEAASALREASSLAASTGFDSTMAGGPAAPSGHAQSNSTSGSLLPGQQHVPAQSLHVSSSRQNHISEPAAKRRARERQPTQKAMDAGLVPALAGQQGQNGRGVSPVQDAQHVQRSHANPVASLSASLPAQHLQAGMPV